VFWSDANNLVSGDTNLGPDIFMKDISTNSLIRISTDADGAQAINQSSSSQSYTPSISDDGRYVVFESTASNLVSGDTNGSFDIFIKDTSTNSIIRVSTAADGTQGNGISYAPVISADGRYVVFNSRASNLVSGDTNGTDDVFIKDLSTNSITRLSIASDGTQGNSNGYTYFRPAISADGRSVVFESTASNLVSDDTNGTLDVFLFTHPVNSLPTLAISDVTVSEGNSGTSNVVFTVTRTGTATQAISVNYVTANSSATASSDYTGTSGTLTFATNETSKTIIVPIIGDTAVEGNETFFVNLSNAVNATIVDNQGLGTITNDDNLNPTRISTAADGTQVDAYSYSPSISDDGRYVVFQSSANNLVSGDTNFAFDIFVKDLSTNSITRVSTAADGTQGNDYSQFPAISGDARYVVFSSYASNLVSGDTNYTEDVFIKDLSTNSITRVSTAADGTQGNNLSSSPTISANGRYVAFQSSANNLVSDDTNGTQDIFIKDLSTNSITRVSTTADGTQGNNHSYSPSISDDGRYVVFQSYDSNLVSGDTNGSFDVFIKDLSTNSITRVSTAADGTQGNGYSVYAAISADGRYVVFTSNANNLVTGDTNGTQDIFVKDLSTNSITHVSTAADGTQANNQSLHAAISADGRYVVFLSGASNLVSGDTNGAYNVFIKDLSTNSITRISTVADGVLPNDSVDVRPGISADGRSVVFVSFASNLVSGDTNGYPDVFLSTQPVTSLPTLAISDVTMAEGNSGTSNAVFTVSRTGNTTQPITVDYVTGNNTATAGSDYTGTSGTLTFAINETSKTIIVPIIGDTTVEGNETFFVSLSNAVNATIADSQGLGTITNDDIA
jgi:Tol biopolymer transport system component